MRIHLKYGAKPLPVALSFLIVFQLVVPAPAQIAPAPAQTMPTELNLVVLEGEGAVNNVRQRVSLEPKVRVDDENHKPVVGAVVVFTLPTEGATGEFVKGSKTLTVVTDATGEARGQGLRINRTNGKLPIHVSASFRGLAARTIINQVIEGGVSAPSSSSGGGHGGLIAVLVVVGAAAAGGGAYFATRNKTTSTPNPPTGPTPIGITAGSGSIAGGK